MFMKSKKIGHRNMAQVEGKKNAYRFLVWQTAGKGALERPRCRKECNNEMHLK